MLTSIATERSSCLQQAPETTSLLPNQAGQYGKSGSGETRLVSQETGWDRYWVGKEVGELVDERGHSHAKADSSRHLEDLLALTARWESGPTLDVSYCGRTLRGRSAKN